MLRLVPRSALLCAVLLAWVGTSTALLPSPASAASSSGELRAVGGINCDGDPPSGEPGGGVVTLNRDGDIVQATVSLSGADPAPYYVEMFVAGNSSCYPDNNGRVGAVLDAVGGDGVATFSFSLPQVWYNGTIDDASSIVVVLDRNAGGDGDSFATNPIAIPAQAPRDTVVVLLGGINPTGVGLRTPSYANVSGTYRDLLVRLGCNDLSPGDITKRCNATDRARLFWSPFSYLGPDGQRAPLAYGGADSHKPLSALGPLLEAQVQQIRIKHHAANLILVGYSEGGTVASRWAADYREWSVPVITLDSMLYGFWPEARSTIQPEDVLNYCGTSRPDNRIAEPGVLAPRTFNLVCSAWTVAGFRSDVSYDWRAGRVFGQDADLTNAVPLTLFSATNRFDYVAPPWWNVSPLADGNKIVNCVDDVGHGCILKNIPATNEIFESIRRVVGSTTAAAQANVPATLSDVKAAWGNSANPAAFAAGVETVISTPPGSRIEAVGEWGLGESEAAAKLACVAKSVEPKSSISVSDSCWRSHSYVVRWRSRSGRVRLSRVRTIPYSNATVFAAQISGRDFLIGDVGDFCA
jgi:pimeloyl-ACP methyl ester carboxylesterase